MAKKTGTVKKKVVKVVSKYYGSMHYDFLYYICLSLLGFAPRLYIYTKIGTVLYNPFSARFIALLMIIVGFSGITSMAFNIYYGRRSRQMNQTLLLYSEKEKYKIFKFYAIKILLNGELHQKL